MIADPGVVYTPVGADAARTRSARTLVEDLRRTLRSAARRPSRVPATVEALLALDPEVAVQWLTDHTYVVGALWTIAERRALVSHAARAVMALANAPSSAIVHPFLEAYGGDLEASTVVACASRIPMGRALLDSMLGGALESDPRDPALLWVAAERAMEAKRYERAHELLTRAGRTDPGAANLARVLHARRRLPPSEGTPARIAIASTSDAEQFMPHLDLECRAAGLEPCIHVCPPGAWEHEIRREDSEMLRFRPDVVFVVPCPDDLIPAFDEGSATPGDAAGTAALDRVCSAVETFRDRSGVPLVVHAFWSERREPLGTARAPGSGVRAWLAALNSRLAARLRGLRDVRLLDPGEVLERSARRPPDASARWQSRAMHLEEDALSALAAAWVRYVVPIRGLARSCVMMDLDNTLWGGSPSEGGIHAVRLADRPPGAAYRDLQRYLKGLARLGITLAVVSSGEERPARTVIRTHPGMILREDDFASIRIDWRPKPTNVADTARELHVSLDSVVFLDDNPYERALMRRLQPGVLVPDLPRDPSLYRACVEAMPQLQRWALDDGGRGRVPA